MRKSAESERKSLGVTVVTCTNRPPYFQRLLANFNRQKYKNKELVVVLNNDSMDIGRLAKQLNGREDIRLFRLSQNIALGSCLNYAVDQAKHAYIARFDDDDYYAPRYLDTMLGVLRTSGAEIVGKRACLVYLEADGKLLLRHPLDQNRQVELVAGATLLCRKEIFRKVRFRPVSLGETVGFLRRCRKRNYTIYSANCLNFVIRRRARKSSHTWQISDRRLLAQSRLIADRDADYRRYATLKRLANPFDHE